MPRRPDPTDDFDAHQTLVAAPRRTPPRPQPAVRQAPRPAPPPQATRPLQARVARGTAAPEPRPLPAFVPAETVVPVVQYRGAPPPPARRSAAVPAAVPDALDPTRATLAEPNRATLAEPNRATLAQPNRTTLAEPTRATLAEPNRATLAEPPAAALPPRAATPTGLVPPPATGYPRWAAPREAAPPAPAPVPAVVRPEISARSSVRGRIVAVVGCRGGAGATTLAVNLGAELARDARACVVDVDVHVGDVLAALDLETRTSVAQLAADLDTSPDLDASAVRRRLALHRSGLFAVGQAAACDPRSFPGLVPGLLRGLARHHDHVVVDGIRGFDDTAVAALAAADQVLLVVTQDVLSVRRAARAVVRLRQLGHGAGLSLVVNRVRPGATVDAAAIEKALGLRIGAAVRDDGRVQAALDDGALLSELPRARDVAHDVGEMARLVDAARRPAARRRGFFGRLLGGS
jgi:pilus assembly protein CpaE